MAYTNRTMLYMIILISQCIYYVWSSSASQQPTCVTGYMTDHQSWVSENGTLTNITESVASIDLSYLEDPVQALHATLSIARDDSSKPSRPRIVTYLSMAGCGLKAVPMFQTLKYKDDIYIKIHVKHLSLYGNKFNTLFLPNEVNNNMEYPADIQRNEIPAISVNQTRTMWSDAFLMQDFSLLLELDLRACFIDVLDNGIFAKMSSLQSLYLGENLIYHVNANAFEGLHSLIHLDLSRNIQTYLTEVIIFDSKDIFKDLHNLSSLDFSFTKLSQKNGITLRHFTPNMRSMSLCNTGLTQLEPNIFKDTQLTVLDVSGNQGILQDPDFLVNVKDTLEVLYAEDTNLKLFKIFYGLSKLQVLKVSNNDLHFIKPETARSLKELKVLDLEFNRISTWETPIFSYMPNLKLLSLRNNNINYLSQEIIRDLAHIGFVGLSENNVVCNCYARNVIIVAYKNEHANLARAIPWNNENHTRYHKAFFEYNKKINERKHVSNIFELKNFEPEIFDSTYTNGDFVLFDYDPENYQCFLPKEGTNIPYGESQCEQTIRTIYEDVIKQSVMKIIIIPIVLIPTLWMIFLFKKEIRYCFLTMRNSTMIGMTQKPVCFDDGTIFHYDVFVSYCNEDRAWVLDHFLPQIEKNSGVSVCLHERDFQVGLSILENIVSCMDRSRSIMLILSKRFLRSQWCQFEMHLAQHRLLETRREDLILILLEEIPRNLRPNTLHYLMLTKTYIVWPADPKQNTIFWKRLKKSLVMQKTQSTPKATTA